MNYGFIITSGDPSTVADLTYIVDYGGWFDWDEGNEGHVARHGVEMFEVEEAFLDPQRIGTGAYDVPLEKRGHRSNIVRADTLCGVHQSQWKGSARYRERCGCRAEKKISKEVTEMTKTRDFLHTELE